MGVSMLQLGGMIIAIIAIINITTMVMNFMGVSVEFYASYLIWIVAILLFFCVLPTQSTNYFS
jgi:hypothetical protein